MKARHVAGAGLLSLFALSASAATVAVQDYDSIRINLANEYIEASSIALMSSDILDEDFVARSFGRATTLAGRLASEVRRPDLDLGLGVRSAIALKVADILDEGFGVRSSHRGANLSGRLASEVRSSASDLGSGVTSASSRLVTAQVPASLLTSDDLQSVGLQVLGGPSAQELFGAAGGIAGVAAGLPAFGEGGTPGSSGQLSGDVQAPAPVPLPAGGALLVTALAALTLLRRGRAEG